MRLHNTLHRTPALAAFALGEPIKPIGYLPSGRAVYPIAGGAPDDPPEEKPTDPPAYTPPASQADLDRIVGDRLARERAKYADYDDLKTKAEAHDAALEAAKSDADKAVDAARTEGEKAATERVNTRLVKSEARVLASAAKFRDPSDAVAFLDLTKVTVNDDGEVDEKAIKDQLDALATSKPYLVDDGRKPSPRSDRSQGGGGGDDKPSLARGREMFEQRRGKKTS